MKSSRNSLYAHLRQSVLAAVTAGSLATAGIAQADEGSVVTSIRPLGMIAAALTEGVTEPDPNYHVSYYCYCCDASCWWYGLAS